MNAVARFGSRSRATRPKTCTAYEHAAGCRPGRPLCKLQRKTRASRRPCACSAYHFTHRTGGGACPGRAGGFDDMPDVLRKSYKSHFGHEPPSSRKTR